MAINDPEIVRREYETDAGLATRKAAYEYATGPDARQMAFEAVAEVKPKRVLEVGCGTGELAERIQRELRCQVIATDLSPHMAGLTRARGVPTLVADAQRLPFRDGEFDVVLAAWMLYHVPDVKLALGEIVRVLRPKGRLVAATNSAEHMRELHVLLGVPPAEATFLSDDGERLLREHLGRVERRDSRGTIEFPDRAAAQRYVDSSFVFFKGRTVPDVPGPISVRRSASILIGVRG
jgi:SAM-dependent methyltransferase